jgi:hypothetical protein
MSETPFDLPEVDPLFPLSEEERGMVLMYRAAKAAKESRFKERELTPEELQARRDAAAKVARRATHRSSLQSVTVPYPVHRNEVKKDEPV